MKDVITSRNNKRVMFAASLKLSKNRNKEELFLMEGYKNLLMAINANCVYEIFSIKEIKDVDDSIPLHIVDSKVISKLSNQSNPEGIVFIAKYPHIERLINKCIYLDDINDPGNMGTIIRTALAFNYDAIYYSKNCVSPFNEKALAASKGAIFDIPLIEEDIKNLKGKYQLVVTALDKNAISIDDLKIKDKHCLVFGNEANGVKKETLLLADIITYIPISNIDSLNVGIASAIYMNKFKN